MWQRRRPFAPRTPGRRGTRRDPELLVGAALALLIASVAAVGPWLAPYDAAATDYTATLLAPAIGSHPFGTDALGRDVLSRVVHGARIDLGLGLACVLAPLVVGIAVGLSAGFFGGWVDALLGRLIDALVAFPFLVLIVALVAVLGPGLRNLIVAASLIGWVGYARLVRAEVLVAKHRDYVAAARAMGCGDARIVGRHLLPNVVAPALVHATSDVVLYVTVAASLSYLGLGARPPSPEWGAMIVDGQTYLTTAWWIGVFPGLAVVLTGIAFALLGDGLADALRPGGSSAANGFRKRVGT